MTNFMPFTDEDTENIPQTAVPDVSFTTPGVFQLLHNLNINKSPGPDQISR